MTDHFAVLGLPRRPGLDEEALKSNYLRLAAALHPDANGGDAERFRELQEARRILTDPAARVRHLLEGENAGAAAAKSPPGDLFLVVAGALEAAKKATVECEGCRSAIARAAVIPKLRAVESRLVVAKELVAKRREDRFGQIKEQDALWPAGDFTILAESAGELVYLNRWDKELKESHFQLRNALDLLLR